MDEANEVDEHQQATSRRRWEIAEFFGQLVAGAILVGLIATWLLRSGDCAQAVIDTQIAGDQDRFSARFASTYPSCTGDQLTGALVRNFFVVLAYCTAVSLLLLRWWNRSWDSEPGKTKLPGWYFSIIAAIAVALSAIGNVITGVSLDIADGTATLGSATLIAAIGWGKWLLVSILGAAAVVMTLSWCVRGASALYRQLRDTSDAAKYVPTSSPWMPEEQRGYQGFGIALSGGGIRSAAFSLGALSALEDTAVRPGERPEALIDQAQLLATVSGGGYTGTAWRIAAGDGERERSGDGDYRRIIGDPNRLVPTAAQRAGINASADEATCLAERLRDRRSFLRNGRGGLAFSAVRLVLQLAFHVGLLLWTVGLVSWLVGRFIGTWAITTPDGGIEYGRLIRPATHALVAFVVFAVARMFTVPGKWRRAWDGLAAFCGAVAVGLAVGLVVVPWAVVELLSALEQIVPGGTGAQSSVAVILTGGLAASAWRVLQAPLRSRAPYLGGVLLALSLVLFAMVVAGEAAKGTSALFFFPDQWWTWALFWLVPYVAMLSSLNPDLWSLHPIYARLLRGTFENRLADDGEWESFSKGEWPALSSYVDAKGPHPVICTAAARGDRANTGLSVVSMTFEPDYVTLHKGATDDGDSKSIAIATSDYEDIFTGRAGESRLRSIIGMAALSAAAVAPSLGRASMGSTDALIAALNLRLGAWLPNPDFPEGQRRIGPHMINMFKELRGRFSLDEPNLYVTDGGHWENMALVELIRRKPAVIVAVDSSLNEPYSFTALLEAKELARVECGAVIKIDPDALAQMRPSDAVRPAKNWCVATIEYAVGPGETAPPTGRMLFVKAQASEALPLDILRYSKEDPNFPNYSTANQMLSDREFSHLAVLGRESMINALEEELAWLFDEYEPLFGAFGPGPVAMVSAAPAADAGPGASGTGGGAFGRAVSDAADGGVVDATDPIVLADAERDPVFSSDGFSLPKKRAAPTGADAAW